MLPSTLRAHIQSWTPTRKCSGLVPSGAVQQHQRSQNPNVFTGKPHISQSQMKKERRTVSWSIVSVEIFLNLDCFQEANTTKVSISFPTSKTQILLNKEKQCSENAWERDFLLRCSLTCVLAMSDRVSLDWKSLVWFWTMSDAKECFYCKFRTILPINYLLYLFLDNMVVMNPSLPARHKC